MAGIGLTITEANHVIHYGRWWNPAVEAQATDRAYRIGQQRPVMVYLPVLRDATGVIARTFDERLDELMRRKQGLAENFLQPTEDEDRLATELCDMLEADADVGTATAVASAVPFTAADLDRLAPYDFEAAVAALFRAEGYATVLTAKAGDGGADVLAVRGGEVLLVQVKHSTSRAPVDGRAVSDVLAAGDVYGPVLRARWRAAVATNGPVAPEAIREAAATGIELIAGERLAGRIAAARVGLGAATAAEADRCATFDEGVRRARSQLGR